MASACGKSSRKTPRLAPEIFRVKPPSKDPWSMLWAEIEKETAFSEINVSRVADIKNRAIQLIRDYGHILGSQVVSQGT